MEIYEINLVLHLIKHLLMQLEIILDILQFIPHNLKCCLCYQSFKINTTDDCLMPQIFGAQLFILIAKWISDQIK